MSPDTEKMGAMQTTNGNLSQMEIYQLKEQNRNTSVLKRRVGFECLDVQLNHAICRPIQQQIWRSTKQFI